MTPKMVVTDLVPKNTNMNAVVIKKPDNRKHKSQMISFFAI